MGCGPSLGEVQIPPYVLTIGTNDSYRKHWSPIYATSDANALRRDYPENLAQALIYYSAIDPSRPIPPIEILPGRPLEPVQKKERSNLRKSGSFAAWVAVNCFRATRIHFIGFDMEVQRGHFDGAIERVGWERTYGAQRKRLRDICANTEAYIWVEDHFMPVASLPVTVREVLPGSKEPLFDRRNFAYLKPPEHLMRKRHG